MLCQKENAVSSQLFGNRLRRPGNLRAQDCRFSLLRIQYGKVAKNKTIDEVFPATAWTYTVVWDRIKEIVSGGMLENRRRYARVPMRAQATCIVDSRTMRGVTWNLSQGGMQLDASDLQLRDTVQLSFRLPGSGVAVDAVGAVVWENEKRHGIRFTNVGAQSQGSIRHYILELEPRLGPRNYAQ